MSAYQIGDEIVFENEIVGDVNAGDIASLIAKTAGEVVPAVIDATKGPQQQQAQKPVLMARLSPGALADLRKGAAGAPEGSSFMDVMKKEYFGLPLWGLLAGGAAIGTGLYLFMRKK